MGDANGVLFLARLQPDGTQARITTLATGSSAASGSVTADFRAASAAAYVALDGAVLFKVNLTTQRIVAKREMPATQRLVHVAWDYMPALGVSPGHALYGLVELRSSVEVQLVRIDTVTLALTPLFTFNTTGTVKFAYLGLPTFGPGASGKHYGVILAPGGARPATQDAQVFLDLPTSGVHAWSLVDAALNLTSFAMEFEEHNCYTTYGSGGAAAGNGNFSIIHVPGTIQQVLSTAAMQNEAQPLAVQATAIDMANGVYYTVAMRKQGGNNQAASFLNAYHYPSGALHSVPLAAQHVFALYFGAQPAII
jgi:hypothetical protein